MINTGFKLTAKDILKLKDFKHSAAYSTYLKCIKSSPVYVSIMKEHTDKINIEEDVNRLKSEGQLPENVPAESLSSLFKLSISRVAINLIADTIILKELEDKALDEVMQGISDDANLLYLTGMGDVKYYREAQKLLEEGKLDKDDVAYRGLIAWMKREEKVPKENKVLKEPKVIQPTPIPTPKSEKRNRQVNLDSLDIEM